MLDGVDAAGADDRLLVGGGDAQVEGGDALRAQVIPPGHIQTRLQFDVVDGEARDLFHYNEPLNMYCTVSAGVSNTASAPAVSSSARSP